MRRGRPVQVLMWARTDVPGVLTNGQRLDIVLLSKRWGTRLAISVIFHKYEEAWMRRKHLASVWAQVHAAWRSQIRAGRAKHARLALQLEADGRTTRFGGNR